MRVLAYVCVGLCALGGLGAGVCASGATLHVDDFQTGTTTLGWTGGAAPTRIATGGQGGADDAFLRISTSSFGGKLATYNAGPNWRGDLAAVGATHLEVDLMSPVTSSPLEIRAVLIGPVNDGNRWTSAAPHSVPNDGVWRHYTFSLAESDIVPVFTTAAYTDLMADTKKVMLRHDLASDGPDYGGVNVIATLNIDNIELVGAVAPLPGDFDGDDDVDDADLTGAAQGWIARFGGDLEGEDFLLWQRQLGATGAAAAVASVPEPAGTTTLVVMTLLGAAARGLGPILHVKGR